MVNICAIAVKTAKEREYKKTFSEINLLKINSNVKSNIAISKKLKSIFPN